MKYSLIQLQKYRANGFQFDEKLNLDYLKDRNKEIRAISPIVVTGSADIESNKVTFHLHILGEIILPCSRTLVDVPHQLDIHSTETFLKELEYESDNEDIHVIQGDMIDLTPVIEELILLDIPLQVISEEAKNNSNILRSGKDWELIDETDLQQKEKIDPRLAGLAKLLEQENE